MPLARRFGFAVILLFAFVLSNFSQASDEKVLNAQVRLSPTGSGAGYLEIRNSSKIPIHLIGAVSPMVDRIEIHSTMSDNGVMKMTPLKAVEIPAGKMLHLKPGGQHFMLFGVMKGLRVGESMPMTLLFAGERRLDITARIVPLTGKSIKHKMKKNQ